MNSDNFTTAKNFFDEGLRLYQEESYGAAEIFFLKSLSLLPNRLSTIRNLISIYIKTYQLNKLEEILIKYESLSGNNEILFGLAFQFHFKKDYSKSINICEQLIKIDEFKYSIQDLLASNYKKKKFFLEAFKIYKKKLSKKKDFLVYYNLGCLFSDLGKTNTAYYYFNKSKLLKNNDNSNLWNLSLCSLRLKNFQYGFALYEYRWKKKAEPLKRKFAEIKSPNNFLEIKDKKILIWDEQGLGDTLQFSRFVVDLLKYSKNITFVVNSKLSKILSNLHKNINVCNYENLKLNNFDYQIPLCSLPNFLNVRTINDIKYYKLDVQSNSKIRFKDNDKINIGLAWSGNPNYSLDEYRSIAFKNFREIFNINNINFFKLSQNIRNEELIEYNSISNLYDFGDKSLYDISQILKDFDLVISSDTSIIHLAGILNINSILLLNYNSDWRWFNDESNTIWYPSVKIIKQEKLDSWEYVFKKLIKELKNLKDKKKEQ